MTAARWWRILQMLALCLLLAGCAAQRLHDEGMVLIDDGRIEEGLERMARAARENPGELRYRVALIRARRSAVERIVADARDAELGGRHEAARMAYERARAIEPDNARVREALRTLGKARVLGEIAGQAQEALRSGDVELAERLVENVLALNPLHAEARAMRTEIDRARLRETAAIPRMRSRLSQPVSLEFRDAQLKMVLDVLSRASGINFLLDKDIKGSTPVTIFVREVPIEDAIELLLVQSRLAKRLINENTVLIYPDTAQKTKEFQDLVIRSFYITNGDVKHTQQMLKTILKVGDLFVDERLNMLVMRDTPEVVRLAEKLIANQDLAEPEVVLEVEVLEVTRSKLTELGLKYPSQLAGPGGTLAGAQILNGGTIAVNSGLVLNLKKEDGDTNILASPRIRVRSRERAKVHIGDRVPVVTAVVTPSTGTPVTTDSIQYLDVGLKLEVEPTVHLDDDVAIKVGLEVSTFTRLPPTPNGTTPIQVSTRNAETMLRLHDGETQVLMGLIRDDDTRTATKVPLLSEIPGIGRLFSSELSDKKKTEVVLLMTPHVVRNVRRPDASLGAIWSGTRNTFRLAPPLAAGKVETGGLAKLAAAPVSAQAAAAVASADVERPERVRDARRPAPRRPAVRPVSYAWQGPQQVRVGDEFEVSLEADTAVPINGSSLQLRFDPAQLEVLDVVAGELLQSDGGQAVLNHKLSAVGGRLVVGLLREPAQGVSGSGSLLKLRLKALRSAPSSQLHLMSVDTTGADKSVLPLKASGPFSVGIAQ